MTKRIILSEISKVFDISGIHGPVTIRGKLLLQELLQMQLLWDDPVGEKLRDFYNYRNDLYLLKNYSIDRRYSRFDIPKIRQLIGFCYASTSVYCAVLYQWSVDFSGTIFVCAKSRVCA